MDDKNLHPEHATHDEHCDCGCDHQHDHEQCDCGCDHDSDLVMLQDESGKEIPFHYVYNCEHEGKEYVFLQAADDEDDSLEIFALKTVEENGEFYDVLDPVDDDLYEVLYEKLLLAASQDCCADDETECHDEHCDCHNNTKK